MKSLKLEKKEMRPISLQLGSADRFPKIHKAFTIKSGILKHY